MNELQIFNFENQRVRTVIKDDDVWFVVKDVCDVLGIGNANMAAARLDNDEVSQTEVIDNLGRSQMTNIVNEMGLYNLILRSDKPEAKTFKRWVTHEVLPSIRKTGVYAVKQLSPELQMFSAIFQSVAKMELEQKQITAQLTKFEEKVAIVQETFLQRDDNWRDGINKMLNAVAKENKNYQELRTDSYRRLEERAGCNLNQRLRNLRERLQREGATKTKIDSVNRLDVIEQEKRLRAIYETIVKEMSLARV